MMSTAGVAVPTIVAMAVVAMPAVIIAAVTIAAVIRIISRVSKIDCWRSYCDGRSTIGSAIAISRRCRVDRRGRWDTKSYPRQGWQRQRETHAHMHPTGLRSRNDSE